MEWCFDQVLNILVDYEMKNLSPFDVVVFLVIARHSWGHIDMLKPIERNDIQSKANMSERSIFKSLSSLQEKGMIKIHSGGGRGKKTVYAINLDYFDKIIQRELNIETKKTLHHIQCITNTVYKGAVHASELPLELGQGSEQKPISTPAALPSASPPAVVLKKNNRKKRSKEETEMKDEIWLMFEDALGAKITGKSAALEAKSIWELIDMMNNGNGWKSDIKEMVSRFISYIKDPPEGFEYLRKCLPLPHILVSPRTWLKMTIKPPEEKKLPTLEETEKYMNDLIEEGFIHK